MLAVFDDSRLRTELESINVESYEAGTKTNDHLNEGWRHHAPDLFGKIGGKEVSTATLAPLRSGEKLNTRTQ
jgi:hypothetical protein